VEKFSELLREAVGDSTVAIHWDYAREVLARADGVLATVGLEADAPDAPAAPAAAAAEPAAATVAPAAGGEMPLSPPAEPPQKPAGEPAASVPTAAPQ